ncbi:hypothetical protein BH09PSE4_BH09PSE4_10340 [soil metagenome]
MPFHQAQTARASGSWGTILALVEADGSARRPILTALQKPNASLRDIADAVHCLCMLHGRHPGVIDHATAHGALPEAQAWLDQAAEAFADERAWLIKLVSAVGPLPSTPGQAETEAAITAQHHALDMLAQSDRGGCAIGAAVAVALDWIALREMLDAVGERLSLAIPASHLPDINETAAMISASSISPGAERAMAFGTQQTLTMHRALWDLIEARASARGPH